LGRSATTAYTPDQSRIPAPGEHVRLIASFVIDTNVLLRVTDTSSAQHKSVLKAIASLKENGQELFIAPQVLMEFWSVATRPAAVNGFGWPVESVRGEINKFLELFPLLPETPTVFEEWLRQVTERKVVGKRVHDARLVALLNTHGITHLLTFNLGDFKDFGITAISPDEILAL
jgi:predicted nucleic acid-binding protein